MIEAYPLCWPHSYKRTAYRQRARFKTSFAHARDSIVKQIKMLGGKNPIISTNIPLRLDGLPYGSYKVPEDPGVSVYFTYQNDQVVFACDKWKCIEDNMQAISKTIEAIRSLDRWGVSDMLKRAFTGFKALPESIIITPEPRIWYEVLEVPDKSDWDFVKQQYRNKCQEYHPDKPNGDRYKFDEVQYAYNRAKQIYNQK